MLVLCRLSATPGLSARFPAMPLPHASNHRYAIPMPILSPQPAAVSLRRLAHLRHSESNRIPSSPRLAVSNLRCALPFHIHAALRRVLSFRGTSQLCRFSSSRGSSSRGHAFPSQCTAAICRFRTACRRQWRDCHPTDRSSLFYSSPIRAVPVSAYPCRAAPLHIRSTQCLFISEPLASEHRPALSFTRPCCRR